MSTFTVHICFMMPLCVVLAPETQALALFPFLILTIWQSSELVIQTKDAERQGWWQAIKQSLISNLQSPLWIILTAVFFALTFLSHPIAYLLLIPIGVWLLIKAGFATEKRPFLAHTYRTRIGHWHWWLFGRLLLVASLFRSAISPAPIFRSVKVMLIKRTFCSCSICSVGPTYLPTQH